MGTASWLYRLVLIFLLLTSSCPGFSYGLKCYVCRYEEGSQNFCNCENEPTNECLVDDIRRPNNYFNKMTQSSEVMTGEWALRRQRSIFNSSGLAQGPHQVLSIGVNEYQDRYCGKTIGSLNGVKQISRFSLNKQYSRSISIGCSTLPSQSGVENGVICYCNTDGCNRARALSESSAIIIFTSIFFQFILLIFA